MDVVKEIPLTVLVSEGPQARAYLYCMQQAGFKPKRILHWVSGVNPQSGKAMGRWLPDFLRERYLVQSQELMQHYWPRYIQRQHPDLVQTLQRDLQPWVACISKAIPAILGPFNYTDYATHTTRVLADDWKAPRLKDALSQLAPAWVLYTGGGLVPAELLRIQGLQVLHVHPGYLPYVRGADGLFWSLLVRAKLGLSCFIMRPGIDTGDIVARAEWDAPKITLPEGKLPDDLTLYRAVFAFIDPFLRAQFLIQEVLQPWPELELTQRLPQDLNAGMSFHFLQSQLRHAALKALFQSV